MIISFRVEHELLGAACQRDRLTLINNYTKKWICTNLFLADMSQYKK